jgi:hypothetical protein
VAGQKGCPQGCGVDVTQRATYFSPRYVEVFLSYPPSWQDALIETLGHRPSTGAMAVDLLTRTIAQPEHLDLYGFDFFRTPDIAHGRNRVVAHDPQAEEHYILGRIAPEHFYVSPEAP